MVKKLLDLIAETFSVNPKTLSDKTTRNDIEKWDSLNSLFLIDALEHEYEVTLSIDDVLEMSSVFQIRKILENHGVDITKI